MRPEQQDGSPERPLNEEDAIRGLHLHYCQHTGNRLDLTFRRMDYWRIFMRGGFTATDLIKTVAFIRKRYWNKQRPEIVQGMLRFSRLVEDVENFEELLCMARDTERNAPPPRTQKTAVLAAVNRQEPARNGEARPTADILKHGYKQLLKELE